MRTLMAFALSAFAAGGAVQPPAAVEPPTIVTVGEGVVRRVPDMAVVTAAVETRGRSPRDAQRQNADVMTTVVKRLMHAGVARDALRTVGLRLEPEFDNESGRRVARGFLTRNTIEIRIGDVSRTGRSPTSRCSPAPRQSTAFFSTSRIGRVPNVKRFDSQWPMRARRPTRRLPEPAVPSIGS